MATFQDLQREQTDEYPRKLYANRGSSFNYQDDFNSKKQSLNFGREQNNRDFDMERKEIQERLDDAVVAQRTIGIGVVIAIIIMLLVVLLCTIAFIYTLITTKKEKRAKVGAVDNANSAGGYQSTQYAGGQYSPPQTPYPGGAYPSYSYGAAPPQGSPPPYRDPSATPSPVTIPLQLEVKLIST